MPPCLVVLTRLSRQISYPAQCERQSQAVPDFAELDYAIVEEIGRGLVVTLVVQDVGERTGR